MFSVFVAALAQIWFVIPIAILPLVLKSRWFKGKAGEFRVNRKLRKLPSDLYTTIKDVTLETPTGTTQIDHIVLSPYGVFVIETKNLQGWIFGSAKQKQWTQKIYRKSSKFQNPLHQNYKHIKTLQSVLDMPDEAIHSVIVFTGDSTFKTSLPDNVIDLKSCLPYITGFKETHLSLEQLKHYRELLQIKRIKPGLMTDIAHTRHVKEIVRRKATQSCPKCGSDMVIRTSRKGTYAGQKFLGCTQFPKCRTRMDLAGIE